MKYENEIRGVLVEILGVGLLRIRAFGWSGQAEACAIEADHLHNLPALIQSLDYEAIAYYLSAERPAFQQVSVQDTSTFESLWKRLECLIQESQTGDAIP